MRRPTSFRQLNQMLGQGGPGQMIGYQPGAAVNALMAAKAAAVDSKIVQNVVPDHPTQIGYQPGAAMAAYTKATDALKAASTTSTGGPGQTYGAKYGAGIDAMMAAKAAADAAAIAASKGMSQSMAQTAQMVQQGLIQPTGVTSTAIPTTYNFTISPSSSSTPGGASTPNNTDIYTPSKETFAPLKINPLWIVAGVGLYLFLKK